MHKIPANSLQKFVTSEGKLVFKQNMHDLALILYLLVLGIVHLTMTFQNLISTSSILLEWGNDIKIFFLKKKKNGVVKVQLYIYWSDKEREVVLSFGPLSFSFFSSTFSFWVVMYTLLWEEDLFSLHVPSCLHHLQTWYWTYHLTPMTCKNHML